MKTHVYCLLLCCCLLPAFSKAQDTLSSKQQFDLINAARKEVYKTRNTGHIQALIASGKLTTPEALAGAYFSKGYISSNIHRLHLEDKSDAELKADSIFMGILGDFDAAIQACSRCSIFNKRDRYEILAEVIPSSNLPSSYLPELKAVGYRPEKNGLGLGLSAWQGDHTWLGVNFSPLAMIKPPYRLRYFDPKPQKQKRSISIPSKDGMLGAAMFSFSYARNLQQPVHDVSLSLFQVNGIILLNPTTFGFQVGKDTEGKRVERGGYYRPEIGVGIGSVSVGYAYNLMFKKAARQFSEKHLLQVRFLHVFNTVKE